MGDKAFILAGLLVGFFFGLMHGMTSPKKLLLCALVGGMVGTCLFIIVFSLTPFHVK